MLGMGGEKVGERERGYLQGNRSTGTFLPQGFLLRAETRKNYIHCKHLLSMPVTFLRMHFICAILSHSLQHLFLHFHCNTFLHVSLGNNLFFARLTAQHGCWSNDM